MNDLSLDTFFNGRIRVHQNPGGYRFSIDSVLLAAGIDPKPGDRILDLGTGCGIIPLILAYRYKEITISGVEIQKEIAELAKCNIAENQLSGRVTVACRNMKDLPVDSIAGPVDWVVTNPPYRRAGSGRVNPNRERAIARHEIMVNLPELMAVVRRMLKTAGKFIIIYPAERLTDCLTEMRGHGIEPKGLRMVHSRHNTEAKLVLVQGAKGVGPGMIVGTPLIIYNDDGEYTPEVEAMFSP
jgi:tRNA1Val (adenine37-N6)-methyltransferase